MRYVGKCSNCGGPVVEPEGWMHAYEPPPRECMNCHARATRPGPVIPMGPPAPRDDAHKLAQEIFAAQQRLAKADVGVKRDE